MGRFAQSQPFYHRLNYECIGVNKVILKHSEKETHLKIYSITIFNKLKFPAEIGVSTNPCAATYCGDEPASEEETKAVQRELDILASGMGSNLMGLVSIHTYGYMFMHPWGHHESGRCARADDHQDMVGIFFSLLLLLISFLFPYDNTMLA